MREDIENKAYDFIEKHENEIMNISRNIFIQNNGEKEDTITFLLNGVLIKISDKGIYVKGEYTDNLYEVPSFEDLEQIFCKEKPKTKGEILCGKIRNATSEFLVDAIAQEDAHAVEVEILNLIIDELLSYIDDDDVVNAVLSKKRKYIPLLVWLEHNKE